MCAWVLANPPRQIPTLLFRLSPSLHPLPLRLPRPPHLHAGERRERGRRWLLDSRRKYSRPRGRVTDKKIGGGNSNFAIPPDARIRALRINLPLIAAGHSRARATRFDHNGCIRGGALTDTVVSRHSSHTHTHARTGPCAGVDGEWRHAIERGITVVGGHSSSKGKWQSTTQTSSCAASSPALVSPREEGRGRGEEGRRAG